jgi:6,7-dimethyl-8-ribityllumazine synthase
MKQVVGKLTAAGLRIGIVVSSFNETVTERLLSGALTALNRTGVSDEDVVVVRVPGSFEIPFAAKQLASSGKCDAVVCLGALIRGETDHYDYLASEVTRAISAVALQENVPMSFGVLTANDVEQALSRAGLKHGNKGAEAAMAAVEMANLEKELGRVLPRARAAARRKK